MDETYVVPQGDFLAVRGFHGLHPELGRPRLATVRNAQIVGRADRVGSFHFAVAPASPHDDDLTSDS
jgi:hypothetical protein